MQKTRVGVLRGGPSNEYEVSLSTGGTVLRNLPEDTYLAHDIFIDRGGNWHMHGAPVPIHDALQRVDVVFNALHGEFGEDGKVQQILESHGVPFTGSDSLASALGMNKALSKEIFLDQGFKTPVYKVFERPVDGELDIEGTARELFRTFPVPTVVKPIASGSSVGVTIARDYVSLIQALELAFSISDNILVEEFIPGVEATCGVIEGFRDAEVYAFPPIEIRPHGDRFFDYEAKYQGKSDEIVPGNFTYKEKELIENLARDAHKALGLRHYSRSDFIVNPRRGVYILEVNTQPGLTEESLFPKALASVGSSLPHFLDHVLGLALGRNKNG